MDLNMIGQEQQELRQEERQNNELRNLWSEGLLESKTGRPESGKCETDCEGKWIEKKMKRKHWQYEDMIRYV